MVIQTQEVMQKELIKLRTKLQKIDEWLSTEELKAARSISINVDYWQARLDAMYQIREKIKHF